MPTATLTGIVLAGDEQYFLVQTAVMMGIPLIIWGAQSGIRAGLGMFSHLNNVEMSRRVSQRFMICLAWKHRIWLARSTILQRRM